MDAVVTFAKNYVFLSLHTCNPLSLHCSGMGVMAMVAHERMGAIWSDCDFGRYYRNIFFAVTHVGRYSLTQRPMEMALLAPDVEVVIGGEGRRNQRLDLVSL